MHLIHYICIMSCLEVNNPDYIFFYYEREPYGKYWDLIKNKINAVQVQPIKMLNGKKLGYAHQSDFIRVEILNEFGGVYADLDTIFVNKIPKELFKKDFVMGQEDLSQPFAGLGNAVIMAKKHSFFGQMWQNGIYDAFNGSWNNHSIIFPHKLSKRFKNDIHIEPQISFYKHIWTDLGLKNIFVDSDLDFKDVYSIHLWEHLAWQDYILKINEESINLIDNTYNILARTYF